jgi:two-component system NtrC family response regulator
MHGGGADIRTTPALLRALMARPWPGNVRELANLCQRMVLLRSGDLLDRADFDAATGAAAASPPVPEREAGALADRLVGELPPGSLPLLELEREIILRALAMHGGNRTRAAAYLGVPRHVLIYRLEKYGLQ